MFNFVATPNETDPINSLLRKEQVTIFRLWTTHAPLDSHINTITKEHLPNCNLCRHTKKMSNTFCWNAQPWQTWEIDSFHETQQSKTHCTVTNNNWRALQNTSRWQTVGGYRPKWLLDQESKVKVKSMTDWCKWHKIMMKSSWCWPHTGHILWKVQPEINEAKEKLLSSNKRISQWAGSLPW